MGAYIGAYIGTLCWDPVLGLPAGGSALLAGLQSGAQVLPRLHERRRRGEAPAEGLRGVAEILEEAQERLATLAPQVHHLLDHVLLQLELHASLLSWGAS